MLRKRPNFFSRNSAKKVRVHFFAQKPEKSQCVWRVKNNFTKGGGFRVIPETLSGAQRAEEQIRSGTGKGRGGGVGIKGTEAWDRMIPVVEGKALGSSERLKPSAVIGSDLEPHGTQAHRTQGSDRGAKRLLPVAKTLGVSP